MHFARLRNSPRLATMMRILADGREHSTAELIDLSRALARNNDGVRLCAINSIASELRANGLAVSVRRQGSRYYYRLGK